MFGRKAKEALEEPTWNDETEETEEDLPTWADGSYGPGSPISRIYGRLPGDELREARIAASD